MDPPPAIARAGLADGRPRLARDVAVRQPRLGAGGRARGGPGRRLPRPRPDRPAGGDLRPRSARRTARVVYDSHELFLDVRRRRRPAVVGGRLAGPSRAGVGGRGRRARHRQRGLRGRARAATRPGRIVVVHNCPPRPVGELVRSDADPRRGRHPGRTRRSCSTTAACGRAAASSSWPRRCSSRASSGCTSRSSASGRCASERRASWRPSRGSAAGSTSSARCRRWTSSAGSRRSTSPRCRSRPTARATTSRPRTRCSRRSRRACRSSRATFPGCAAIVAEDPDGPLGELCDPADPASIGAAIRTIVELRQRTHGPSSPARCRQAGDRALELGDRVGPAGRALPAPRTDRVTAEAASSAAERSSAAGDARAAVERRVRLAGLADRERPRRPRPRGHGAGSPGGGLPDAEVHPAGYRIVRVPVSAATGCPDRSGRSPAAVRGPRAAPPPDDPRPSEPDDAEPGRRARALLGRVRTAWSRAASAWPRSRLTVRSQRLASRPVAPPADLVHAMAYMGIPIGLDLGRRDRRAGRLRRPGHLRRRRATSPACRGRRAGCSAAVERRWARRAGRVVTVNQPVRGGDGSDGSACRCR